jgi:filamentous hemagglutinin
VNIQFDESGSTVGAFGVSQTKQALHADVPVPSDPSVNGPLHSGDTQPVRLYAAGGDISGLTLFAPKASRIVAGLDITNIAFYLQNISDSDISVVSAGRDILPFDVESPLFLEATDVASGNLIADNSTNGLAGDIEIGGPGTLEVLAGRNLTLGISAANNSDGTGVGIVSIGQAANPALSFNGADVIAAAGLGGPSMASGGGLSGSPADFQSFITEFIDGPTGAQYFADLAQTDPGLDVSSLDDFNKLDQEQKDNVALQIFYLVLRDAGRDHNLAGSVGFGNYAAGLAAIAALFPTASPFGGDIDLTSREIETTSGGNISILAPAGQLTVGIDLGGKQPVDQGILTEDGGNVSIFTNGNVNVGTSRIFTLRGGNEIIWSTAGNIDAGAASKTVQSAPPTRVLVDPQSADVQTDLAGLATGGGIGVLASVVGVPPGSVDLIAPAGVINAGDAGIRATGNLNLAAVQVLNASNIQAGGASSGVPTVTVAAPNLGAISAANSSVGATQAAANQQANAQDQNQTAESDEPSIIDVEVLGYGGGDSDSQDSQGG